MYYLVDKYKYSDQKIILVLSSWRIIGKVYGNEAALAVIITDWHPWFKVFFLTFNDTNFKYI